MIVLSALMIWKSLMVLTKSESPVVVVLSGSMEPAFQRGDILFLSNYGAPSLDSHPAAYPRVAQLYCWPCRCTRAWRVALTVCVTANGRRGTGLLRAAVLPLPLVFRRRPDPSW